MRFLLVDDDERLLATIEDWVVACYPDAKVVAVGSAAAGLACLASESFDVLLADVVMESLDAGWQLARAARSRNVRVLLMSGDDRASSLAFERGIALIHKGELSRARLDALLAGVLLGDRDESTTPERNERD